MAFSPTAATLQATPGLPWRFSTAAAPATSRYRRAFGSPEASGPPVSSGVSSDADNYYLARLDLDRQDIGLYRVVGGTRTRIEGEDDLELDTNAWHTLRIVHEDENIRVYLGGIRVLRARDRTLDQSGAAGMWCTGDAIAHFDDLRVAGAGDRNGDRDGKNEDSHRGR